jgi:hypothetical protein
MGARLKGPRGAASLPVDNGLSARSTRRLRNTGGAISRMTLNPNGPQQQGIRSLNKFLVDHMGHDRLTYECDGGSLTGRADLIHRRLRAPQLDLLLSVSRAACHGKPGPPHVRCRARTHAIHSLSRRSAFWLRR